METSPMNVTDTDPINTLDSEESALEEDPELAGDLCDVILEKRGKDQPCPVKRAAHSVMDPQVEVVTGTPSQDAAALPIEEDPEQVDDLHNIILDERDEDQPCQVGTAAESVVDTQAEVVTNAPSPDTATLPTEEALGEPTPPSSGLTEAPETQDLGVNSSPPL